MSRMIRQKMSREIAKFEYSSEDEERSEEN